MDSRRPTFRAGWRWRSETVETAASSILAMLKGFKSCLPELTEWSCKPPSFETVPLTADYISEQLRRSGKRLKFSDLGFGFAAWSGTKDRSFALNLNIGQTSRVVPNNRVNLDLPLDLWPEEKTVKCILATLAHVWRPEFAAYNPLYPRKERRFELGEMVFLAPEIARCLDAVSFQDVRREAFESGHLLYLKPAEIERAYRQAVFLNDSDDSLLPPTQ